MIVAAYHAWLTGHGQKNQTFEDYCKRMGLIDAERLTKQESELVAQYAREKAARIVAADQPGPAVVADQPKEKVVTDG